MADNFKNSNTKSAKVGNSSKCLRIRKQRKKKQNTKRKNKQYFKRKRLIRSLVFRKKKLKMNINSNMTPEVLPSSHRWQHEDEIAFWKSRAVSLAYENKMLHKHIKQMYIGMITHNQELIENENEEYLEENSEYKEKELYIKNKEKNKIKKKHELDDDEDSKPPVEQISKKREEEMKMLYGSSWRTIIGMETAVQLNYDLTVEKNNSKYWPVIPINI